MQSHGKTRNIAFMGMFCAASMLLGYIENLIPFDFGVPGIKLGLANLGCVVILYTFGPVYALIVNLIRIVLSGLLFGNLSMILYSLAGAILSFICMVLVKKTDKTSPVGVSLTGGVAHNIGQLIIAGLVLDTMPILYYIPVLMISGALCGALIGYINVLVLPAIRKVINNGQE